jgi:hypothetical protein
MLAYKCVIELAGQENYPKSFEEVGGIIITLRDNLNSRLCTVPASELAKILDLLPVPQLASALAALLMEEVGPGICGVRLNAILS